MKFLADTNVISELRKGARAHPNVRRWSERTPGRLIGTSILVLAEIRRGIELKRLNDKAQARALDRWYTAMRERLADRVLSIDEAVAGTWAVLSAAKPVPLIDGLLAATALTHRLILVTRNTRHAAATGADVFDPFVWS